MHDAVLSSVRSLGYKVSGDYVNGVVEMHALLLSDPDQQHLARVDDDGPEATYRRACVLAETSPLSKNTASHRIDAERRRESCPRARRRSK
jgi:hypothetical protein